MTTQFIIDFIISSDEDVEEYFLLKFIEEQHPNFFDSLGESPSLYKKHFFLFHQLYLLRDDLLKQGKSLIISGTKISIRDQTRSSTAISDTDALSEFYLNLDNLALSDEDVSEMLNKFWQKYLAIDKKAEALQVLGLHNTTDLNKKTIKSRYAELAQKHHPDKGGDEQMFIKIKEAANTLKHLFY